jgi:hypothetical protein
MPVALVAGWTDYLRAISDQMAAELCSLTIQGEDDFMANPAVVPHGAHRRGLVPGENAAKWQRQR